VRATDPDTYARHLLWTWVVIFAVMLTLTQILPDPEAPAGCEGLKMQEMFACLDG